MPAASPSAEPEKKTINWIEIKSGYTGIVTPEPEERPLKVEKPIIIPKKRKYSWSQEQTKLIKDRRARDTELGAEIRFAYTDVQENSAAINSYDVYRAYLTLKKRFAPRTNMRLTLDVGRLDSSIDPSKKSQKLFAYLKYGYFEFPVEELFDVNVRMGLQPNMWIDWV